MGLLPSQAGAITVIPWGYYRHN